MEVKDIILEDYDLVIENGDFKVSSSDNQHIELICITDLGHWKEYPLVGVGIQKYIASSGQTESLKRTINVQLSADGYNVSQVEVIGSNEDFQYYIDATRD